jgi:cell division transport system ATP-binding protein
MNNDQVILDVSGVSKIYDRKWCALRDVSFQVSRGEFVLLVGPCGAGKTTLIRLITREESPTEGTIRVVGEDISSLDRRDIPRMRRKLGLVFQDGKLLAERTIFENIAFALRVTGARKKEISKKVMTALTLVGLAHKVGLLPNQLSGGEQQKAAIARALVNKPLLLLADEPTGNLDPDVSMEILDLFEKINRFGTAIMLATHDTNLVRGLPHRRVEIVSGRMA